MSRTKLIFFDIDGTLVNFDDVIPASAKKAIRLAHQAGHKLFLCTGRGGSQVDRRLKALPLDGVISSTGADVRIGRKVLFKRELKGEKLKRLVNAMERSGAYYALQGYRCIAMNEESLKRMSDRFREIGADEARIATLFDGVKLMEDLTKAPGVEKAIYYHADIPVPEVRSLLGDDFAVDPVSFDEPLDTNGEVTQRGINKSFGIMRLMEHFDIPREDTIAFGDGPNDLDMLDFVGCGVAMGNAWDIVKERADMVAPPIYEDGIWQAMKSLSLF